MRPTTILLLTLVALPCQAQGDDLEARRHELRAAYAASASAAERRAILGELRLMEREGSFDGQPGTPVPIEIPPEPPRHENTGHGSLADDWSALDYALHQRLFDAAVGARALGTPNAARHLLHYLENSGGPIPVPVDRMLDDLPGLRKRYAEEIARLVERAGRRIAAEGIVDGAFELTGSRETYYAHRKESADWFLALGGFTYWTTANVVVEDGRALLHVHLHVSDRYDWDDGKATSFLWGLKDVSDESLLRLHLVGLAQHFDIKGTGGRRVVLGPTNP